MPSNYIHDTTVSTYTSTLAQSPHRITIWATQHCSKPCLSLHLEFRSAAGRLWAAPRVWLQSLLK